MKFNYDIIKEVLEAIYLLSSVGLLIGIFVGLKQLNLMKRDFEVKNERASIEKSIEYLNVFATEFIPQASSIINRIKKDVAQPYKGPLNTEFRFDKNCNPQSEYIQEIIRAYTQNDAFDILNRFEYFSAAFVSGLADEELAFIPLSRIYCSYIEDFYVILCYLRRSEDENSFEYTVKLYNIWNKRLERSRLEKRRSELDEEISKIQEERIRYIGND